MKKCPYCAEEIQDEAIKCKHCGANLNEPPQRTAASLNPAIGETLGLIMLFLPIATSVLVWFWVGGMNLFEGPGSKLNLLMVITILGTAILATIEASKLGMGSPSDVNKKGKRNSGPIAWFFLMILLWIVAYPAYLFTRSKYGLKNYLALGIIIAVVFTGSFYVMASSVNEKVAEIQKEGQKLQNASQSLQSWGESNDESAQANLRVLSTASEVYATANNGYYPSDISVLLNANPPYINQNLCNATIDGYVYSCSFSETGYVFTATPTQSGKAVYTVTTGGVFK